MVTSKNKIFFLGVGAAFFLWFAEATIHVVIFRYGSFYEEILSLNNLHELWMRLLTVTIILLFGYISQRVANKITAAYRKEKELTKKLEDSFQEIKVLRGLLPICASCKKIRDKKGYWNQIEIYIKDRSEAEFTHSLCPECTKKLYPEFADKLHKKQ